MWLEVLSGVPQGSVLGPLLFLIFINDIDQAVSTIEIIRKFADDTKIGNSMVTMEDKRKLQEALDKLCQWAETWGMSFNTKKCKVMYIGRTNPHHNFFMDGQVLGSTEEERDIGVTVSSDLKPSAHCANAARTAQAVLGQISRAFHYRDRHVFVRLYKQYVRPHLEFCTQAWSPWTMADREALEKVQRKAVGMVSGLTAHVYEDRLKELGLQSLEERRHQADMLMMHMIMHGGGGLDHQTWFTKGSDSGRATRSTADPLNVTVKNGRLDIRSKFLSVRAPAQWNAVPSDIKQLQPAQRFKTAYKQFRENPV